MKKAVFRLLSLTLLAFSCLSWGFFGHKKINRYAVFSLPPEMFTFYKSHIEYLTQHAVDPDKRRYVSETEAVKHYIDIDHFAEEGQDPFSVVPAKWREAIERYGEDSLKQFGILPWNIQWQYHKLIENFKQKDAGSILQTSAELGHYLADAHVPLHTTENYNGQLTGQKGIHGLWESRLPELFFSEFDLLTDKAELIRDPLSTAWEIVKESHLLVDTVLYLERLVSIQLGDASKYVFEKRGNQISQQYSLKFCESYHKLMKGMVEERMRLAIHRLASYWYTAWLEAGQPELSELRLGKDLELGTDSLENALKKASEILGREH